MIEIDNIYNEDCLDGMKRIPDGSVDAIICDLPYGTTKNSWDCLIPLDKLWAEYKRVIKTSGAIVLFSQQPFTSALVMSNPKMFRYEWIWEKEMGTGFLNANYAPLKSHENILVFSNLAACYVKNPADAMVYHPQMTEGKPYTCKQGKMEHNYDTKNMVAAIETKNEGKRYPKTILHYNRDKVKIHPTQKPVELVRYLIRTYSSPDETILDNCMGSGTTAIAAIKEHRHYIGFELNSEYYEKGINRIKTESQQTSLFDL
jgi:site-specific DNA-methyltransferase (adenine-specific)